MKKLVDRSLPRPPGPAAALLLVFAIFSLPPPAGAQTFPGATWAQMTPSEAGLDVAKLQQLQSLVTGSGMIVRGGYQVYAWGNLSQSRNWASASKPVISTMLFLAAHEGLCSTTSPMSLYMTGGSAKDRSITFHHLANMISGYSRGENPGAAWAYNDHAIQLYGYALYQGVFGEEPSEVFPERVSFLQFEDNPFVSDTQYGRLVSVSIRDFSRIGLFWLRRGQWNGVERIDASFFNLVTNQVPTATPTTSLDGPESWDLGTFGGGDNQPFDARGMYGYNFWVNANGLWPGVPTDVFHANGHGGQEVCTVFPTQDLVATGIGSWGTPGSALFNSALQLLGQAVLAPVAARSGLETDSWGAIKEKYSP